MSTPEVKIQVSKNEFVWNQDEGLLKFDGAPALLFWDSAIELFLKTIEEVSGEDVSKTVYEATGYRMGHLVSSYYEGREDIEQLLVDYGDIYRSAGWGNVSITSYSFEEKKAVVRLRNSWEHRIFNDSDREKAGGLLPSHWAGVFTGLFKQNMWYKVVKSQLDGHEYDEIELFPSTITPSRNIHELARQKEQQSIQELEQKVHARTKELESLVKDLSSPVIPVLEGILVIPLIGKFNEERLSDLIETALVEISSRKANYLIVDLTGISNVDEHTLHGIQRLVKSIRLLGAECFLVGISPKLSVHITKSNIEIKGITTFTSLQACVEYAIEQNGFQLITKHKK